MLHAFVKAKSSCLAALLLAPALPATGCDDGATGPNQFVAEERLSFTFDVADQVLLSVAAKNGNVTVTGVAGGTSLTVEGVRKVWSHSQDDADAHLDLLEVSVEENPDDFVISTEQPQVSGGRAYVVNYTITLPDDFEVAIVNANGNITVIAVKEDVNITNSNGEIRLNGIEGSVAADISNGEIDAAVTLPLDGTLVMSVGNGEIGLSVPQNTSAEFSAEVGNGSITVVNLTLQNQVTTPRSVTGTLGAGQGTVSLAVGNGVITVTGS